MTELRLGVIADDLTGALDTGVQFSKWGLESLVALSEVQLEAACVVINTDSRALPPKAAQIRVRLAARALRDRLVYKKIDSTLRGNIGAELWAAMEEMRASKAVVAPAFPANGRTTLGGRVFVRGVPLEQTGFARDPRNAIRESHLPTVLQGELGQQVATVGLDVVEQGPDRVYDAIATTVERVIAVDAVTQDHLVTIARSITRSAGRWLPVGSAGLAEEIAPALGLRKKQRGTSAPPCSGKPILVIAGSRNDVCAAQLREAVALLEWPVIEPETYRLMDPAERVPEIERVVAVAGESLREGRSAIVTTCFAGLVDAGSQSIAQALGEVTRRAAESYPFGGLFLTGGDIALEVCRALSAQALRPFDEVLPGLPASRLSGGPWDGLWIVTKAGGFGEKNAIVVGCQYLTGDGQQ